MNLKGRPWRVDPSKLREHLRELRTKRGLSHKMIGETLGYSHDRIKKLCAKWNIKKEFKPKKGVASEVSDVETIDTFVPQLPP